MNMNRLSDKKTARLSRQVGVVFAKAATNHTGVIVDGVTADDQHYRFNRKTGELEGPIVNPTHWSSCGAGE